ncbi:hypothetical protein [Peribacillus asahii]|uniref:hypothetical protein n=1 Tax=Peribacillus asahii TaxID=228899 RepID=UPI0038303839
MQTVQSNKDREKIEAIQKILRAFMLRNELLSVLGINTGLRISDILALKVSDVLTKTEVVDWLGLGEKKTKRSESLP